ncbi:DUF6378 domain-containing protein [bacterium]|nr:DUF6378 domain-containing protein [bacterium]
MKRDEVLATAGEYINGQRAEDYGDAYENFERIAEGWNTIIRNAMKTHGYVTPQHVALMMDWVKTARLLNDIRHDDSWIDKCGYSALGGEFTEREKTISKRLDMFIRKPNE